MIKHTTPLLSWHQPDYIVLESEITSSSLTGEGKETTGGGALNTA